MFNFKITENSKKSKARIGKIITPNGEINTPAFIFCATKGFLRGITCQQLKECKTQVILSNTYHLDIFPGSEKIKEMGGLHKATCWGGPMLTDSGGYQVFAMGHGSVSEEIKGKRNGWSPTLHKITEEGAVFKSYYDQSLKTLTPEKSIQIQKNLGADLIVVFDECTAFNVSKEYTESSMHRSHRWSNRSIEEYKKLKITNQALYGIIQGGIYQDLRKISIDFNNNCQDLFGIAIGGSLGSDKQTMYRTIEYTMDKIRKDKPIHLLGIGGIADIFHGIRQGIDTFDCVHPTRLGRHGCVLVKAKYWDEDENKNKKPKESIDITKSQFKKDLNVIDKECGCTTCKQGYSRMYLNYLFKLNESLGGTLITIHNIYFMNNLMESIRESIKNDTIDQEEENWLVPELRYNNRKSMFISGDL